MGFLRRLVYPKAGSIPSERWTLARPVEKKMDARVVRTWQKVLDASAALILEKGAGNFTVEAVVERTGVALTTIYRHWRSRNDLLSEAIVHLSDPVPYPDCGSTRDDLISFFLGRMDLTHWDEKLRTVPGIIEAGRTDSKIAVVVTQFMTGLHKTVQIMLQRGQERGDVRRDLDLSAMADILLGAVILRRGYRGEKISQAAIAAMLDTIMEGIAAPKARSGAQP
jgi:AcrR family transcriptional regulator